MSSIEMCVYMSLAHSVGRCVLWVLLVGGINKNLGMYNIRVESKRHSNWCEWMVVGMSAIES